MPPSDTLADVIGRMIHGDLWDAKRTELLALAERARKRDEQVANSKSAMWAAAGLLSIVVSLCLTVILLTLTARYVF